MSDERLVRIEDMMGQLIGMVGKVLSEQHDMKQDIHSMKQDIRSMKQDMQTMNQSMERVEIEQTRFNDSVAYLLDKTAQHDHDIHGLKSRVLKL
ncbi:hypothetical protein [Cohnella herbarum]|uniref:Uncharacterized protein n=1 Tax=Cohnella herbarum TaxID=2728023 RepID=A0A7Z2VG71_9BACL|nr:hypothetical protein [Cohnella herbarum]QJD82345.1 hypothetical protein HH215_03530 [Cohnella herbarum]